MPPVRCPIVTWSFTWSGRSWTPPARDPAHLLLPHAERRRSGTDGVYQPARGRGDNLVLYRGHIGYGVDPEYRGHGYAARACALLLPLARLHGLNPLCGSPATLRTSLHAGPANASARSWPRSSPCRKGRKRTWLGRGRSAATGSASERAVSTQRYGEKKSHGRRGGEILRHAESTRLHAGGCRLRKNRAQA